MGETTDRTRGTQLPFRLSCPRCEGDLLCRDRRALGRQVRCPRCRHRFQACPASAAEASPVEPPPRGFPVLVCAGAALAVTLGVVLACYGVSGKSDEARQQSQRQAEQARLAEVAKRLEEEKRAELRGAEEQKKAKLTELLASAREAKARKSFSEAEQVYAEALQVDPQNFVARTGLQSVAQAQADEERLAKEVAGLLGRAQAAETRGADAEAIALYSEVLSRAPGDRTVSERLRTLQEGQAQAARSADAERRHTDHLSLGKAYLTGLRFADAEQEYRKALELMPGSRAASAGLSAALKEQYQEKLNAMAAKQEAERRAKEQEEYRQERARAERVAEREGERSARLLETSMVTGSQTQQANAAAMGQMQSAAYAAAGQSAQANAAAAAQLGQANADVKIAAIKKGIYVRLPSGKIVFRPAW